MSQTKEKTVRFTALNTKPTEEVEEMVREAMQKGCPDIAVKLLEVRHVNHKPHPYVVGPKHIEAAQDYGGRLGLEVMEKLPSAAFGSGRDGFSGTMLEDITFDVVAFLQLTDNVPQSDMVKLGDALQPLEDVHLSGLALVETEEKFRVQPSEVDE